MKISKMTNRKGMHITFVISFLIFQTVPILFGQDGCNKASIAGGASFGLEPLWSVQIDPRWKAGEVIGNLLAIAGEDAHVRLYQIKTKMEK
jgi:hypothetical protein